VPVPPAELTAEFTIHPFTEGRIEPHVRAGIDAAEASGLAVEVGPLGTGLSGERSAVLDALRAVVDAAVDAGAQSVHIKLEAPASRD
jgi:uncharacterized protein YqgV (UPF0045/DUF77 family)